MSDKPILFSAPMVRALLAGTKTQTRRLAGVPVIEQTPNGLWHIHTRHGGETVMTPAPAESELGRQAADYLPIQPGDRMWVRENFAIAPTSAWALPKTVSPDPDMAAYYEADFDRSGRPRWKPSIHMPRWASRITLHVTDVRVQRLGDISDEDAKAEGIVFTDFGQYTPPGMMSVDGGPFYPLKPRQHEGWHWGEVSGPGECLGSPVSAYANLWGNINGPGSWEANPWVAAYTFTVERVNIEQARSE